MGNSGRDLPMRGRRAQISVAFVFVLYFHFIVLALGGMLDDNPMCFFIFYLSSDSSYFLCCFLTRP